MKETESIWKISPLAPELGREGVLSGRPLPAARGAGALPDLSAGIRGNENHGVPHPGVWLLFRAPALSVCISCNIHHTGLFMGPSLGSYFSGLVNKTLAFAACHGGCRPSDVSLKTAFSSSQRLHFTEIYLYFIGHLLFFFSPRLGDVGQSRVLFSSD